MNPFLKTAYRTIVTAAVLAACGGGRDAKNVPLAQVNAVDSAAAAASAHALIGPAAKAALDSGNVLFRNKAFAAALAQYESASTLAPQHAAPLFGIYMVARATNDTAMAERALTGIRQRGGSMSPAPHTLPPAHPAMTPAKGGA